MNIILKTFLLFSVAVLLSACSYKKDVDLTKEEINTIKDKITETKANIDNYDDSDGSVPVPEIVALARAYEKLGEIGKAIKVYENVLKSGHRVRVVFHNLGRLYEKVGKYDLAVEQYSILTDEYFERNYLYDITWAYIKDKNRKEAEKYFNAWQLEFRKTDQQTQRAIKKLREEEKNNS